MHQQIHRRTLLAGAAAFALPPLRAQGLSYPAKPVRIIVSFTAGGTTDILARSVSQKLADRFKQAFVVDNKPGAGGNIGTELAARAAPDGYTLIVSSVGPITVNPTLYAKMSVNPLTDLVPVVQIADSPNVIVVNPAVVSAKTLEELLAYLKTQPDLANYGSTGVGTSSHLAAYMLTRRANVEATHIPYKGADALKDLLAGRIGFMFATVPSVIAHIQARKLRALAVSSAKRSRALPQVPTVAERGFPGFEASSWTGFFAPKNTPEDIVATLNAGVNAALPALESQMVREGADPVGGTPQQFRQFVAREYEKWRTVVRESGATAE